MTLAMTKSIFFISLENPNNKTHEILACRTTFSQIILTMRRENERRFRISVFRGEGENSFPIFRCCFFSCQKATPENAARSMLSEPRGRRAFAHSPPPRQPKKRRKIGFLLTFSHSWKIFPNSNGKKSFSTVKSAIIAAVEIRVERKSGFLSSVSASIILSLRGQGRERKRRIINVLAKRKRCFA